MKRRMIPSWLILIALGAGCATRAHAALRDLAPQCGVLIGPAVSYSPLMNEPIYASTFGAEFNIFTPENEMKWDRIHPQRYTYSFTRADAEVSYATSHQIALHGHTLVWHQQLPSWLTGGSFGRDEMIQILRDHINTVVGRYRGSAAVWDVVNEAFNDDGTLRETLWLDRIGPDYIDLAFQFAAQADPNARLVINDYSNEMPNAKSDGIYNMVSGMVARGVPIHGVGFQIHTTVGEVDLPSFSQNLQRFADLGLQVYITELDVRLWLPPTPDDLAGQADTYRGLLDACIAQPACKAFQMWGFTDAHSWIPGFFPGFGAALIFDPIYLPKPAYGALADRLRQCGPTGAPRVTTN